MAMVEGMEPPLLTSVIAMVVASEIFVSKENSSMPRGYGYGYRVRVGVRVIVMVRVRVRFGSPP